MSRIGDWIKETIRWERPGVHIKPVGSDSDAQSKGITIVEHITEHLNLGVGAIVVDKMAKKELDQPSKLSI